MTRALQVFRIGALFALLWVAIGQNPPASALGLCSVESCDCTAGCQCQGMITCCEAVCGDCLADLGCAAR